MDVVESEIHFYRTADGKVAFEQWRSALGDLQSRSLVRARLARLRAGNWGDCKALGQGLFELRIFYGPGYRIYVSPVGGKRLLILAAGDKRTQTRDIEEARSYLADYRRRT